MAYRKSSQWTGRAAILSLAVVAGGAAHALTQAPAKTNLKKILVLDKSQGGANGHRESRRDLNAALRELAEEKGFAVTIIGQDDPASKIATEFSAASLATYQAVLFSNNDGVHAQLNSTEKTNLEAYVKNGGGFIPIHAASAFISNWPWITNVLVESFYNPHGDNMPTANVAHDGEGTKVGTETQGIFKGLTAPLAFLDEYYSFRASPRGRPGVTILLTVDEQSFSKPVRGPMGSDHPVVWAKTDGKGRVVHMSMGHSWATNNVYTAKNGYLKKFLYGTLRYVAGDFTGCTDNEFVEYNPDATRSEPDACVTRKGVSIGASGSGEARTLVYRRDGTSDIRIRFQAPGAHAVTLLDVAGRVVDRRSGAGPSEYSLPTPSRGGIYTVVARIDGAETRHRVTVL
jgi:type 1 glutamine amidotransferase